jgi:hypothetical protein
VSLTPAGTTVSFSAVTSSDHSGHGFKLPLIDVARRVNKLEKAVILDIFSLRSSGPAIVAHDTRRIKVIAFGEVKVN